MPNKGRRQTSIWIAPEDDEAVTLIREEHGVNSIADAVRFALRRVADQIKAKRRRARRATSGPDGEGES